MGGRKGLLPTSAVKQGQPSPAVILQSPQMIRVSVCGGKFLASSKPAENRVHGGFLEMKMPEVLPASYLLLNTHLERAISK